MKVAYCGPISLRILAPDFAELHGLGDGYAYPFGAYYVQELLSRGHEVVVVTNAYTASACLEYRSGKLSLFVSPRRRPKQFIFDAYAKEREMMLQAIVESKPDVVHAQWCYEFAHVAKASGFPYVVTLRDAPWIVLKHFRNGYRLFRLLYAYWVMFGVQTSTAVSGYIASSFRKYFGTSAITVVPNALDESLLSKRPKQLNGSGNWLFVTTSSWGRLKNCKTLFRAFADVRKVYPNAELAVIGTGLGKDDEGAEWAEENQLAEGVQFLGRVPHDEILQLLEQSADLFIYTSLQESFCMAVLEAMAKGVPAVVLPDTGALPWLVEAGRCGVVASTQEAHDLAQACIELLENPDRYESISRSALERVSSEFTMARVADKYVDVYQKALG